MHQPGGGVVSAADAADGATAKQSGTPMVQMVEFSRLMSGRLGRSVVVRSPFEHIVADRPPGPPSGGTDYQGRDTAPFAFRSAAT